MKSEIDRMKNLLSLLNERTFGNVLQFNEAIRIQFPLSYRHLLIDPIFDFNSVINESFHGSSSDAWSISEGWRLFNGVTLQLTVDNVVKIQISSFLRTFKDLENCRKNVETRMNAWSDNAT